jgi:hypothetical protein
MEYALSNPGHWLQPIDCKLLTMSTRLLFDRNSLLPMVRFRPLAHHCEKRQKSKLNNISHAAIAFFSHDLRVYAELYANCRLPT